MPRRVAILSINLVVFCVFAELLALGFYAYEHGRFFYIDQNRPVYELIAETGEHSLTSEGLHPYFGPIHRPRLPFDIPDILLKPSRDGAGPSGVPAIPSVETNNFGFVSRHDYPFRKSTADQFVIGMFGGSVGVWFCQVGAQPFLEQLSRQSFFTEKELIPLCFSHEGYKQPQQLLVLSYFLSIGQQFDLVVNIDGFNEVAISNLNHQRGWDVSMPSVIHLDPMINLVNQSTLTPAKLRSLARIEDDKERLNTLARGIYLSPLASMRVALEQYHRIVANRYQAELVAFGGLPSTPSESSIIHVTQSLMGRAGTDVFENIARQWITASSLMHDMLAARGVGYFHFLQPNQYHTVRAFGEAEATVALSGESPFRDGVERGYPFLVMASEALSGMSGGGYVFNGTGIFDDEPSPVYWDNCCHYTLRGNEMLADFMARSILNSTGPWSGL